MFDNIFKFTNFYSAFIKISKIRQIISAYLYIYIYIIFDIYACIYASYTIYHILKDNPSLFHPPRQTWPNPNDW